MLLWILCSQVVISLPLWMKLSMGQLLLFFLCSFCSIFSYVKGVLIINLFSLSLVHIDRSSRTKVLCKKGVSQSLEAPACSRLWHRRFPVNFAKFLRTHFLQRPSRGCFCIGIGIFSFQEIITHEVHLCCDTLFDLQRSSELSQECWQHSQNNRK